jgi:hypothetical protein
MPNSEQDIVSRHMSRLGKKGGAVTGAKLKGTQEAKDRGRAAVKIRWDRYRAKKAQEVGK